MLTVISGIRTGAYVSIFLSPHLRLLTIFSSIDINMLDANHFVSWKLFLVMNAY